VKVGGGVGACGAYSTHLRGGFEDLNGNILKCYADIRFANGHPKE